MEDIRTKSENTTPRQRAAAQIPKEAMRQLWLRSKEKGRTEIESTADGQQGGQYSEANQTGEKVSDALQSVGKSSAKVAVHKGRELAKKRAGQRHMEQSVERQEQTGQQSFSELQAPDGGQVSSNLTEPRECSVPSGKENPSANHSRISDSAKQTSDRNIKSNRLSVKEKPHDIKTAPHEIRGVSRDRKQIRTAASTVQAEQVAQQKAQQMAQRTRQAAKNASKQTRKAVKAVRAAIRHFLAALHTLTVAIIAGMSAATAVVVIICLVAFIAGSAYGIFFAAEAPDAALVCTAPLTHAAIISELLDNSLPVFTELNLVADGYEENMAKAKEKGVLLFLSSTMLYRRETQYIKQQVAAFGKPVHYIYHIGQYLPDWHPWENYKNFFVGNARTGGVREIFGIDLPWLLDAFGDVTHVTVQEDSISDLGLPYPDCVTLLLRHASGAQGVLAADVVSPKAVRNFECFGDGLHLFWEGNPKALYEFKNGDKQFVDTYTSFEHDNRYSDNIVENAYVDELTNFFACLRGEETSRWSFEQDLAAIRIMDKT